MPRTSLPIILCVSLLAASVASAGEEAPPDPYFRVFTVFLKGGASFYTGDYATYTQWGPSWGAGFGLSPTKWLTFEVAYEGSHNQTQGAFFTQPDKPGLLRNGVDALLKLTLPLEWFRPFVGAGYGVSWLGATGSNTTGLGSAFLQEVPVAGGIEFMAGPVVIGARFTYRFLFSNGIVVQDPNLPNLHGGLGDVQLTLGGAF